MYTISQLYKDSILQGSQIFSKKIIRNVLKAFFICITFFLGLCSIAMEPNHQQRIIKLPIATLPTKNINLHIHIPENFRSLEQEGDECIEYVPQKDPINPWQVYSQVLSIRKVISETTTAKKEREMFQETLERCAQKIEPINTLSLENETYQKEVLVTSYIYNKRPEVSHVCFYSNKFNHIAFCYTIVCNKFSKKKALNKLQKFIDQNTFLFINPKFRETP